MTGSVMLGQTSIGLFGRGMAQKLEKAASRLDDAALVRQFQAGNDQAGVVEILFDRYALLSYAFFCRSVGDRRRAEDLNQELFLEVIKGLPRFRLESSFKTWLFRLAYNHLANLRRRLRTRPDEWKNETPDDLWEQLLPDPASAPDAQLEAERTKVLLRGCLVRLPEIERAIVLGHYYGGSTLKQLTEDLKLTNASGARAYLIAAQRKLKKCMERALSPGAESSS